MGKYELVVLFDSAVSKNDLEANIKKVEDLLWKSILEKDDIGLLDLAYKIKKRERAYFISYLLEFDWKKIIWLKDEFVIMPWMMRYFFYVMKPTQTFLKFKEVNQKEIKEEENIKEEDVNNVENQKEE